MRIHLLVRGCGIAAALSLLGTGARAQFNDYTRRVPVTVTNNDASPTPAPTSAEVTIPFNPATMRADRADVRVGYDGGSGLHEIDSQLFRETVSGTDSVRVVFRLQQSIAAGASSTGQYYVYYGNPTPTDGPKRVLKNVFDHIVDFNDPSNVVGQPAPDWDVQVGNTMKVESYQGKKVGVLSGATYNHLRATVKQSAMPAFLNVEALAHYAAYGNGTRQIGGLIRVDANPASTSFQGGYGYGVGWGSSSGDGRFIASFINPNYPGSAPPGNNPYTSDPVALGAVISSSPVVQQDLFVSTLSRVTGNPGLIKGKNWNDGNTEPSDWILQRDRSAFDPRRNLFGTSTADPVYNQAGTVGMMGYAQRAAVEYIALRELRDLTNAAGAEETLTPAGPFLQGTVTSNVPSLNPLQNVTLHITGPGVDVTFSPDSNGHYKLTVPAGSYTVVASAPYHATATVNANASASDLTDITLSKNKAAVRNQVARVPAIPNSAQKPRIWIYSDTVPGETTYVNVSINNGAPVSIAGTEDSSYPGANWYADLPSAKDGASVKYEIVTKDAGGAFYGATGMGANGMQYTVADLNLPTGGPVNSAPAVMAGKAYFGSDDGKLYGYDLASRTALAGFPYDAKSIAGTGAKILGRPALRYAGGNLYAFFLSNNGYIFRLHLNNDGSLDTGTIPPVAYQPDTTATNVATTPAVFDIGGADYIFAAMTTSTGASLFKVPVAAMTSHADLRFNTGSEAVSSPAGGGGLDVYVGVTGTADKGIYRVNAADLAVTSSFASGEGVSTPPFISGTAAFGLSVPTLYIGTDDGNVYAANATNGIPVASFGNNGKTVAWNGRKIAGSVLLNKKFYVLVAGVTDILRIDAETGLKTDWYNIGYQSGGQPAVAIAADPNVNGKDYIFTSHAAFFAVRTNVADVSDQTVYRAPDWVNVKTTPAVDLTTNQVVIGSSNNRAYVYPR